MPRFDAERFCDGFAQSDAGVFDGVVLIDVQIALRFDFQIDGAVPRDEIEHVIEEANAGRDCGCAAPVEIQMQTDVVSLVLRSIVAVQCAAFCFWPQR